MTDNDILRAFHQGQSASNADKCIAENPYAPCSEAELYDAWLAGYVDQEGPAYQLTPLGTKRPKTPTLGDLWPA